MNYCFTYYIILIRFKHVHHQIPEAAVVSLLVTDSEVCFSTLLMFQDGKCRAKSVCGFFDKHEHRHILGLRITTTQSDRKL